MVAGAAASKGRRGGFGPQRRLAATRGGSGVTLCDYLFIIFLETENGTLLPFCNSGIIKIKET